MEEILEKLQKMTIDEQKEYLKKNIDEDEIIDIVLKLSEKEKFQLMDILDTVDKATLIKSFNDDNIKIKALEKTNFNSEIISSVINTFESDKSKIELLKYAKDDYTKGAIISSLNDEKEKIKYLSIVGETAKGTIISTLSQNLKEKYLQNAKKSFKNELNLVKIIKTMPAEKRVKYLDILDQDIHIIDIIDGLGEISDDTKINLLNKDVKSEKAKMELICSLESDDKKAECLKYVNKNSSKQEIVLSMIDKEKRLSEIKNVKTKPAQIIGKIAENGHKVPKEFLGDNYGNLKLGLDPKITFGIEIEAEGEMAKLLRDLEYLKIEKKYGKENKWITKKDITLDNGAEVVSPICRDNEEFVEDIDIICNMEKEAGFSVSERCGGHVHIGADFLTTKQSYINLCEIYGNTEKLLYLISNKKGEVPRNFIKSSAEPISEELDYGIKNGLLELNDEEDLDDFIKDIQKVQAMRDHGINFKNINEEKEKNTVEFRIANGTLDPAQWKDNIKLFGKIMEVSEKLAKIQEKSQKSNYDLKLLNLKEKLKQDIPEEEKLENLLDLLEFSEKEKKKYIEKYTINSCLLDKDGIYNSLANYEFKKIDFPSKHTKDEFGEIAKKQKELNLNENYYMQDLDRVNVFYKS